MPVHSVAGELGIEEDLLYCVFDVDAWQGIEVLEERIVSQNRVESGGEGIVLDSSLDIHCGTPDGDHQSGIHD